MTSPSPAWKDCSPGLALALLLAIAAGCGDSQKPATTTPQAAPSAPAGTEEEEEGYGEVGEGGTIPEGFPDEFRLPGAVSTMWGAWGSDGQLVAFRTDQAPTGVYQHFVDDLPGAGWEIGDASVSAAGTEDQSWEISATRASQQVRISITRNAEGSSFAIAVGAKP